LRRVRRRLAALGLDPRRGAFDRCTGGLLLRTLPRGQPQQAGTGDRGTRQHRVAPHELARDPGAGAHRAERGAGFDPLHRLARHGLADAVAQFADQFQRAILRIAQLAHGGASDGGVTVAGSLCSAVFMARERGCGWFSRRPRIPALAGMPTRA